MVDILAALSAVATTRSSETCVVGRMLASFPDDTPGKPDLVATFETTDREDPNYRKQADLTALARALGHPISMKSIGMHLRRECRCYGYVA